MDFTLTLAITVYHKPHHNEIFDSFHLFSTLFFGFDYLLYLLFPLFIFLSLVWILLLHSTAMENSIAHSIFLFIANDYLIWFLNTLIRFIKFHQLLK